MHCAKAELPAVFDAPLGSWRMIEWEGMNVEYMSFQQEVDASQLLLDGSEGWCPCPHWGYVIHGQVRIVFADHEEIFHAGEVCYIAPGHRPIFGANSEFVAFSLAESYRPVIEVVTRKLATLRQQAEQTTTVP